MSVEKRFSVSLDVKQPTSNRDIEVVEGDTGNILIVTLTDNGQAVNLTDCKVCAVFAKPNGNTAMQDTDGNGLTVAGEDMNEITIELYNTSFSPGMVTCEIQVFSGEDMATLITSAQFNFKCRRGIANEDTIQATDEWPLLVGMLQRVADAEEAVEQWAIAEAERAGAEEARELAEGERETAEDAREAAEAERVRAEEERKQADEWREAFTNGMEAEAVTLPAGSDATAYLDTSGDVAVIRLGIPQGAAGKDAVNIAMSGFLYFRIDEYGDLWACTADGAGEAPPVYINDDGELIYQII